MGALACTDCEAGRYQDKKEQTSCNECGAVIVNSDSVEIGAASSSVCSCAKNFYDARVAGSYNESDTTELDPNNPDESRCQPCPRIGGEGGTICVDCSTPGQTRDSLVTLRGFYRQNVETLKYFRCKDVDYPGMDESTSLMCLGGVAGDGVGELRTSEERRLKGKPPKKQPNTTSQDSSSGNTTAEAEAAKIYSQCAEGRVGPLCNKCGPFGKYLEVRDTEDETKTVCVSCAKLNSSMPINYDTLTTLLGLFFLFAFYLGALKYMTATGLIFQMMDEDDSGSIEVGEFIDAVRTYAGYSKDQLSNKELV